MSESEVSTWICAMRSLVTWLKGGRRLVPMRAGQLNLGATPIAAKTGSSERIATSPSRSVCPSSSQE
jgi:hypothetical protein